MLWDSYLIGTPPNIDNVIAFLISSCPYIDGATDI